MSLLLNLGKACPFLHVRLFGRVWLSRALADKQRILFSFERDFKSKRKDARRQINAPFIGMIRLNQHRVWHPSASIQQRVQNVDFGTLYVDFQYTHIVATGVLHEIKQGSDRDGLKLLLLNNI